MFFIYGRYKERQKQGLVAEHCSRCGVQPFWVVASYTVTHLFFVPFGRFGGATTIRCSRCDLEMEYQASRYSWMLPPHAGADYDVVAMAERTTPSLCRASGAGQRVVVNVGLTTDYAQLSGRLAQKETPPQVAARRLTSSGAEGPVADDLRKRLTQWDSLDETARDVLLGEVDTYSTKAARMLDAVSLIKGMAMQRPSGRARFVFIAILVAVPMLLSFLPLPSWLSVGGGLAIGLVIGRLLANRVEHASYQAWFRREVIPRARERKIGVDTLRTVLAEFNASSSKALLGDVQEVAQHYDDYAAVSQAD